MSAGNDVIPHPINVTSALAEAACDANATCQAFTFRGNILPAVHAVMPIVSNSFTFTFRGNSLLACLYANSL